MSFSYVNPSRNEIEIEKLWQKIDELDDEICDREKKKREIMNQMYFIEHDLVIKGRDV